MFIFPKEQYCKLHSASWHRIREVAITKAWKLLLISSEAAEENPHKKKILLTSAVRNIKELLLKLAIVERLNA